MRKVENDCVGCDLPCIGSACPFKRVPHFYCDRCEADVETLYIMDDGEEVCEDCLKESFIKVELDDWEPDDDYDEPEYDKYHGEY